MMPSSTDTPLKQGEGAFHGVRVNVSDGIDLLAVIDSLVFYSWDPSPLHCEGIRCEVVREDHVHVFADVLSDITCNRSCLHIAGVEHAKLAIALTNSDYDFFFCSASR